jgi:hypothetical protein
MNQNEIWKAVVGYEGIYEVSNLGRVRSLDRVKIGSRHNSKLKGKLLSLRIINHGYCAVVLYNTNSNISKTVHRIVAEAFIANPEGKKEVNHINLIKDDNRVENLEWCTRSENMIHAGKNGKLGGTKGMFIGSKSVRSKIVESDVIEIRRLSKEEKLSSPKIQGLFPSINARHIRDIINRVYWTHI